MSKIIFYAINPTGCWHEFTENMSIHGKAGYSTCEKCGTCDFEVEEIPNFKEKECPNEIQHYFEEI